MLENIVWYFLIENRKLEMLRKEDHSTQRIPSFLFHLEIWKLGIQWELLFWWYTGIIASYLREYWVSEAM